VQETILGIQGGDLVSPWEYHRPTRDGESEDAAAGRPVLDLDLATLDLDQLLDDEKAEAGAADVACFGALDAVELLEDAGFVVVGYPGATVGNPNANDVAIGREADIDDGASI
jgi:hypothetical protein